MQMVYAATVSDAFLNAMIVVLVVFGALVVLSLVIGWFGFFGKKSAPAKKDAAAPVVAPETPSVAAQDEEELVAVIGAAVAMMQPEGVQYAVKKITPVRKKMNTAKRSEWAAAAIRQNTMPF